MTTEPAAPADSDPDVTNLASALDVTEGIVAGVRPEQAHLPTPCSKYEVAQLLDHLVGYATNFADRAAGVTPPADPTTTVAGDDPGAAYRDAGARLVAGYRGGASGDASPPDVVLVETITHGWDLATATGQPTPYTEASIVTALDTCRGMLSPKYRGEGMPFAEEVEVSSSASALEQLVGFMGRDPDWSARA
jgi:uncharacterized protein (TIGR03086 family)